MVRQLFKYGAPVLHQRAVDVDEITSDTRALIDDLVETMYAAPGIGIAATQIGVSRRIFIVDLSVGRNASDLFVMVNPVFLEREGMQLEEESCLSVPGFSATVARPARVVVRGLDRAGREHTVEGEGLLARALQHEMDHLDGVLFVDRLRGVKRDLIRRRIHKLTRAGRW